MLKKKVSIFVVALLAALSALFVASPASASVDDCPLGSFCIWTSSSFTGSRYQYSLATILNGRNAGIRLPSGISNRGYSFYNRLGAQRSLAILDSGTCNTSPWYRVMVNNQYAQASASNDWGGRVSSIQMASAITSPPLGC